MTTEKEQLEAEIAERDARIAELEAIVPTESELRAKAERATAELEREIAALKAQQPSAGVADGWAAFNEAWPAIAGNLPPHQRPWSAYSASEVEFAERNAAEEAWMACARLSRCRAQAVPEGYVVVPVEPTQAMFEAGRTSASGSYAEKLSMAGYWRAMLAAAPSAKMEGE